MNIFLIFIASVALRPTKLARVKINSFAFILIVAPQLTSSRCICGAKTSEQNSRIVGGQIASPNEFPWQVFLAGIGRDPFCGGSLINTKYVLTAGHCIYQRHAWKIRVVLGEYDYAKRNQARQELGVEKLILHPQYDKHLLINDIGLVKMTSSVTFSNTAKPACFFRPTINFAGVLAVTSGWGKTSENGRQSHVLRKVNVPLVSLDECRRAFGHNVIVSSMLCGLYKAGGKDACQGDSGGPLMYYYDNRYYLIGLISWGYGCARPNYPAIYTRVDQFYGWINANTKDAKTCND